MTNTLLVIIPYWDSETWIFDGEAASLEREPFLLSIPDARQGFRLVFSDKAFSGAENTLIRDLAEMGGAWYRTSDPHGEGWLCPALYRYLAQAPKKLFMRAEPPPRPVGPYRKKWWKFWK